MKIMYIYDAIARIGGVERIQVDKMNYLAEVYGHEVYLITSSQGLHPFSFPLSDKVKHMDINARFHLQYQYGYPKRMWVRWKLDRAFIRNLTSQIAATNPDFVIGTTYYKADVICNMKCRAKKIIESHCAKSYTGVNDGIKRNRIAAWLHHHRLLKYNRAIERKSDILVTLTQEDAKEWNKQENISVIPDMIVQIPGTKASCEKHRVISVGRLIYQKGFDRLVEAWSLIHKSHPDWQLDIFGSGPLQEELQRLISGNHLDNVVTIHPPTTRIIEEFLQSSIYVMSSRFEGFGLVLAEAMSCGLPCVSFDCPYGPSDIIRHGEDGMLVEKDNVQLLAESITLLIEKNDMRREYGCKATINAKRFYSDTIMRQWELLLKQQK